MNENAVNTQVSKYARKNKNKLINEQIKQNNNGKNE